MITNSDAINATSFFFGGIDASGRNETTIRNEIKNKFDDIRRLTEELHRLNANPAGVNDPQRFVEIMRQSFPYMKVFERGVPNGQNDRRLSVLSVGVYGAPFYVYDGEGNPLYTSAPMNTMTLNITRNSIVGFTVTSELWGGIRRGIPDEVAMDGISFGNTYGHPHDSRTELNSEHRNSLCFGYDGGVDELFHNLVDRSALVRLLRRLYAWLTEVNVGSTYHRFASPVHFTGEVYTRVHGECANLFDEIKEFMRSDAYMAFVAKARDDGVLDATEVDWAGMNGRISTAIGATSTEGYGFNLVSSLASTAGVGKHMTLASHRYLSAMLEIAKSNDWDRNSIPVMLALSDLVVIPKAFTNHAQSRALSLADDNGEFKGELQKYFMDYERLTA